MSKNPVGRPPVFTPMQRRHMAKVIRQHGLAIGRAVLANEGVSVSLPTLARVAREHGIQLKRGRRDLVF